ncbi:MAG TPA: ribonuclease HI family protein [Candidatus Paceibacterota bacterium]|nr:ribonuclease HI family protein [Candidatus Paceibacterota bacterium]
MPITIYTDGGARGNPGPAGAGVVIELGNQTIELKKFLGEKQTNNWAEYEAVAIALQELQSRGITNRPLAFLLDSKLVVEQILGNWKIKEPTLKPQVAKVHALLSAFPSYTFSHIPREENSEADRLVNEAIDEAKK